MSTKFPTFQRWMNVALPLPQGRRSSWAQSKALLRLMVAGVEENLPLAPLVAAWADDERGYQRQRLRRLAELLQAGTPLPDAVEEVRGVLGDEDILAIRFGAQSGTLAASLRERLDEPGPLISSVSPRMRQMMLYFAAMLIIGSFVITYMQIYVVPEMAKIVEEFDIPMPRTLHWSAIVSIYLARYWYIVLLAVLALYWLFFSSWPGRRLRRTILTRVIRPLRELHTADVLEKLGVTIGAGRPISGALSTLARYHFDPTLRNQLLFLRNEVEQGADVWGSMAAIGLLTAPEARVLETAERVGNRPWALKQIAEVKKRRTLRRLGQLSELALPAVILLFGSYVLFQCLGVFEFLTDIVYSQL